MLGVIGFLQDLLLPAHQAAVKGFRVSGLGFGLGVWDLEFGLSISRLKFWDQLPSKLEKIYSHRSTVEHADLFQSCTMA